MAEELEAIKKEGRGERCYGGEGGALAEVEKTSCTVGTFLFLLMFHKLLQVLQHYSKISDMSDMTIEISLIFCNLNNLSSHMNKCKKNLFFQHWL